MAAYNDGGEDLPFFWNAARSDLSKKIQSEMKDIDETAAIYTELVLYFQRENIPIITETWVESLPADLKEELGKDTFDTSIPNICVQNAAVHVANFMETLYKHPQLEALTSGNNIRFRIAHTYGNLLVWGALPVARIFTIYPSIDIVMPYRRLFNAAHCLQGLHGSICQAAEGGIRHIITEIPKYSGGKRPRFVPKAPIQELIGAKIYLSGYHYIAQAADVPEFYAAYQFITAQTFEAVREKINTAFGAAHKTVISETMLSPPNMGKTYIFRRAAENKISCFLWMAADDGGCYLTDSGKLSALTATFQFAIAALRLFIFAANTPRNTEEEALQIVRAGMEIALSELITVHVGSITMSSTYKYNAATLVVVQPQPRPTTGAGNHPAVDLFGEELWTETPAGEYVYSRGGNSTDDSRLWYSIENHNTELIPIGE